MWKTNDHNVSETGSVFVLRWMGQDKPTQLGPLGRASLNHWTNPGVWVLMLRPTVSRPVCLGAKHHPVLTTRSLLHVWELRSCSCGVPSLTIGRVCPLYMPAQSFSGPRPLGLETIFYCLTFETSLFVASYNSQGHSGGIRPHLHTGQPSTGFISGR
jgi:hypothetical protein